MFKMLAVFVLTLILSGEAWALDEFEGVKCGSDIPRALSGKRSSDEKVVVIEERHRDLGLKDLGGSDVTDQLSSVSWRICGSEFELLVDNKSKLIRDVLQFPSHSKTSPMFIGQCKVDGREIPETVMAVLDNHSGLNARDRARAEVLLKATAAWKIDEAHGRFVALPVTGLGCPLGGIVTSDGGP
jgi:hypothetical protein